MTPMQLELHSARKERLARFAEASASKAALVARLRRQSEIERQRRIEEREEERRTFIAEQVTETEVRYNRPAFPVRKELLLQTLETHDVGLDELMSQRRKVKLVAARQELYARLKHFTRMSLPQIGRFCGDRDHTTILHGVKKYQEAQAALSCVNS